MFLNRSDIENEIERLDYLLKRNSKRNDFVFRKLKSHWTMLKKDLEGE